MSSEHPAPSGQPHWFTTTHWSIVLTARGGSPDAQAALQRLCQTYWQPLYAFVRRSGHSEHDAGDLTQDFFAHLLGRDFLAEVSPHKGRFRSWLLAALKNFLASEYKRAHAQKRGGGVSFVPLDAGPEEAFLCEPTARETPESIFERRWALGLLGRAFEKIRAEFTAAGKSRLFDRLKEYLQDSTGRGDYTEAARDLGLTPSAVAVAVHRLRQRYGELLYREVADTVSSPEEIEDELRHLMTVLGRGGGESL